MGYVRDQDVKAATILPEVEQGDEDEDLPDDWDAIQYMVDSLILCKLFLMLSFSKTCDSNPYRFCDPWVFTKPMTSITATMGMGAGCP